MFSLRELIEIKELISRASLQGREVDGYIKLREKIIQNIEQLKGGEQNGK
jgi:hypothetical protein